MAKKNETRKYQAVPYAKVAKLYSENKTMEQIAKAVNRFHKDADDRTKSLRAIVSGMLTRGYKNEAGRVVKLKKRARTVETTPTKKSEAKPRKATAKKVEATPELVTA